MSNDTLESRAVPEWAVGKLDQNLMYDLGDRFRQQLADEATYLAEAWAGQYCFYGLESPIEVLFLVALQTRWRGFHGEFHPPGTDGKVDTRYDPEEQPLRPHILNAYAEIQQEICGARVDFVVGLFPRDCPVKVIVECAGHDFHERTKEQAARDRARDRSFQAAGWSVFRFTGSEIFRDPFACVQEVERFLCDRYSDWAIQRARDPILRSDAEGKT